MREDEGGTRMVAMRAPPQTRDKSDLEFDLRSLLHLPTFLTLIEGASGLSR